LNEYVQREGKYRQIHSQTVKQVDEMKEVCYCVINLYINEYDRLLSERSDEAI